MTTGSENLNTGLDNYPEEGRPLSKAVTATHAAFKARPLAHLPSPPLFPRSVPHLHAACYYDKEGCAN